MQDFLGVPLEINQLVAACVKVSAASTGLKLARVVGFTASRVRVVVSGESEGEEILTIRPRKLAVLGRTAEIP